MIKSLLHYLSPFTLFLLVVLASCRPIDENKYLEEGVSKLLATYRNATIRDVSYRLSFNIPDTKEKPIAGHSIIEFTLDSRREPLLIDFRAPEDYLESLTVNGQTLPSEIINGHIVIPGKHLRRSYNRIETEFRAGDMSLNRNDDYLYTLFVPDRASTAFPCFDQPDIKARYNLTLEIPPGYRAMSNSPALDIDTTGSSIRIRFSETKPISTYLFAFAAGRFDLIEKEIDGVKMEMLHRETRKGYIENNADEIFRLHLSSLRWLEKYTDIRYPFEKFGFVLIPSFQYSGMEHPGSIFYRASSLLLEESPTLNERLSRASLIAHETSHLWFGDLVTMRWFDDVWLKEVFAGYMADKIVNPDFPDINHDLRFFLSRYPAAYSVDRTGGSNPVIQQLDNMKDAGSLYGAIIYNKAPIVMRLLEQITGEDALQKGIQVYLKTYSWSNASWDDLITILAEVSFKPLEEWSRMWMREAGMPVIMTEVTDDSAGYMIRFSEKDPEGGVRHWPQTLKAMVITPNDTVTGEIIAGDRNSYITVPEMPLCIIPDISGMGYGTFLFDSLSMEYLTDSISTVDEPLLRGVAWVNLFENLINGTIRPLTMYDAVFRALATEEDLQLRNHLAGRLSDIYWNYLSAAERTEAAGEAETFAWEMVKNASDRSEQRTWFTLFRNVALTDTGISLLKETWVKGELPGGNILSEDDLCTLSLVLALKGHRDWQSITDAQRLRITGKDRLARYDFVLPSVSPSGSVRDAFFNTLRDPVNREHEPWVLEALGYLHHPLSADSSLRYIPASLEMLEEIKSTGDIFFPGGWISATLAGHHSPEAREMVEKFLEENPDYPADLRLKILQAADHLFRTDFHANNTADHPQKSVN